jgi:hypothetical protein
MPLVAPLLATDADPRNVLQMSAIFTEQYAREQALVERRRIADPARLVVPEQVRNHVIAYAWPSDGVEPTVVAFQGTFNWPHFIVDLSALQELDLVITPAEPLDARFKLCNSTLRIWTKIKPGHVITLKEQQPIFLKGNLVTHCLGFDSLPQVNGRSHHDSTPYIRKDLCHERTYVPHARKSAKLEADILELSSKDVSFHAVTMVKKESLEDAPLAAIYKRKRQLSDDSTSSRSSLLSPNDEDHIVLWPADFHVVEIVAGFKACDKARRAGKNVGKTFTALFDVPFKRSTYYANRRRWDSAPKAVRDKFVASGKTEAGLWTEFMKETQRRTA